MGSRACYTCANKCQKSNHKLEKKAPTIPRFFKLVFGKEYKNLLYLPPMFTRTVPHLVDQETQIEDKDGKRWSVIVSKIENSLAFQKGWREFFEDHDLEQGDFLCFKYKGSHFSVRIFGKSAMESDFNTKMPRQNKFKRPRRGQVTAFEGGPSQTADVNSGVKPTSATSSAVGSEIQTRQTNIAVKNGDCGGMQLVEDLTCMMNRNDGNYQGEDRNLDFSIFEMLNRTADPSNFQKGINMKADPSSDDAEHTKTMGGDAETGVVCKSPIKGNSGDFLTEKLEKNETTDPHKGRGDIPDAKFEKAIETDIVPEITEQTINKGGIVEAVTHSSETAGHSGGIVTGKPLKKPFGNREMSKGTLDDASNDQNDKHVINIKKELMEIENEGKAPALVANDDLMFSPEVKIETDLLHDIEPSVAISPFSAEVMSKSYLELPAEFPQICGRKDRGKGKLVCLLNSLGKGYLVYYRDRSDIKVLTHWGKFCNDNNIKPGDECRFTQAEYEYAQWAFRVEVIRSK